MLDIVINGGLLIDGQQKEAYKCNIGVAGGKIAALSSLQLEGKEQIDAEGCIVCPGLIDIHMHEDPLKEENGQSKIEEGIFKTMVRMGVTTCIGGNCGIGMTDLGTYQKAVDTYGLPVNFGSFIGYSALREHIGVMDRYRPCSSEERDQVKYLVYKGLECGALGVSFGLEYTPGSTTDEILEIAKIIKDYPGKMLSAHFRSDADKGEEALKELIYISAAAEVPMQISHIGSCVGYGMMREGLSIYEKAIKAGLDISADCYPYEAFSTFIGSAVFDDGCFERWNKGEDAILVTSGKYKGQRCTKEIFDYLRKEEPNMLAVAFVMDGKDIDLALSHPNIMIASDGLLSNGMGHPRAAGTFPRVLGHYVRERKVLELAEAVRKMSTMQADRLGLGKKGRIKIGNDADILVFNPDSILDGADFENPLNEPTGIHQVIVNGKSVVKNGSIQTIRPGVNIRF